MESTCRPVVAVTGAAQGLGFGIDLDEAAAASAAD
jgi:hypothetical protein